jgi:hypothetical protein
MSINVSLEGLPELREKMRDFSERRVAAAIATSLTRAAKDMAGQWQDQINRRIHQPNPRTRSATTFESANANTLQARVLVKDKLSGTSPSEYLAPNEYAGSRNVKKFEAALQASGALPRGWVTVPGRGAKFDAYGNVARAQIIAVITQLGQDYSPGYQRVIPKTVGGRLAAMARRGKSYIAIQPIESQPMKIAPGIYEIQGTGLSKVLAAIFLFKRTATYRKQLDLQAHAIREAPIIIAEEFGIAVSESFDRLMAQRARRAGANGAV